MECPYCGGKTRVIDSRPINDGIRRRRECIQEGIRFTTYERLVPAQLKVVKSDGSREDFDPDKLERVVHRLAGADGLDDEQVQRIVNRVLVKANQLRESEARSYDLALLLIDELRPVHPLAYHRFLANYTDVDGEMLPPPNADEVEPPDDETEEPVEAAAKRPQLDLFAKDDEAG